MRLYPLLLVSIATALGACAGNDGGETSDEDLSTPALSSRFADLKKIRTENLERLAAGYASSGLNNILSSNGNGITLGTPVVFGAADEANRLVPETGKVHGVDKIVAGLASRFGDSEFATQLNALRLDHIRTSSDAYYVESSFDVGANIDHGWSFPASGLTNDSVNLGFNAGTKLGARVVLASTSGGLAAAVRSTTAAAQATRGFVVPRSSADIRAMKMGEMFGLRGTGQLGANLGIGAPILVTTPATALGYSVVASIGAATVLSGRIDVQLIRLADDEVAVEVGIEDAKVASFGTVVQGGWGVNTICDDGEPCLKPTNIGGVEVDLRGMVARALLNRVNETFKTRVALNGSNGSTRVTISRMRFHLDRGAEAEKALELALKADVRLAQAMYNRDLGEASPAVMVDFDLMRSASTSSRDFGASIFGIDIYRRTVVEREGEFVVQTPDGTQAVLFDSLEKRGGFFQMDHGFKRTGISALSIGAAGNVAGGAKSESNLFVQTALADTHMHNDIFIDSADALIVAMAGRAALAPLDAYGSAMQAALWETCPIRVTQDSNGNPDRKTWNEACNVQLLNSGQRVVKFGGTLLSLIEARTHGLTAFKAALAEAHVAGAHEQLLMSAAELRLTLQTVGIHDFDATNGAGASLALNMRFDDATLSALSQQPSDAYRQALTNYVAAVSVKRGESGDQSDRMNRWRSNIDEMTTVFAQRARVLRVLSETEHVRIPEALAGKRYAAAPMGVRFSMDRSDNDAILSSISEQRAKAAAALFDGLYESARSFRFLDLYPEHVAAYSLLALAPAESVEVGFDLKVNTSSNFWGSRERFRIAGLQDLAVVSKGPKASAIASGLFSIDALTTSP